MIRAGGAAGQGNKYLARGWEIASSPARVRGAAERSYTRGAEARRRRERLGSISWVVRWLCCWCWRRAGVGGGEGGGG
jgi:hypothetical protein